MANHIGAIHVLKAKLRLSDDDYRALLKGLTLKTSSKDMSPAEQQKVRDHMQGLAERMGVVQPTTAGPCLPAGLPSPKPTPRQKSARCGRCGTSSGVMALCATPARRR